MIAHAGSVLTAAQAAWVETAAQDAREAVLGECRGLWCDALPCFVQHEWAAGRKALASSPSSSTNAAVGCWLQVGLIPPPPLPLPCIPIVTMAVNTGQCCIVADCFEFFLCLLLTLHI